MSLILQKIRQNKKMVIIFFYSPVYSSPYRAIRRVFIRKYELHEKKGERERERERVFGVITIFMASSFSHMV